MSASVKKPATVERGGPIQAFFQPAGAPRLPMIDRGDGIYLWDTDGNRTIDLSSGPIACNIGHANPRVLDAMVAQAKKISFAAPAQFENAPAIALADLVTELAGPGLERAFFVSGGSEANESAIKLARQYAVATGQESRWKVIGRDPGYHGGTLGTLAAGGDANATAMFGPLTRMMPKVPAPFSYRPPENHTAHTWAAASAEALEQVIQREGPESVLAFIMEPVGGVATGALVAPAAYYQRVREICTRHGVLLIHDEVMSGAGRTGRFLAGEHWGVTPDIAVLAKGLAAGYTPFGAVLASARMMDAIARGGGFMHGFTYLSNPLSCAIALAVTREVVDQGLVERADRMGALFRARLEAFAADTATIGDVRGKGLLMAVELVADKATKASLPGSVNAPARFARISRQHGITAYSRRTNGGKYGDWFMASPPLIVTEAEIDEIMDGLRATFREFEDGLLREGMI